MCDTVELTPGDRETLMSAARLALQTYVKTGRMPDLELRSPGVCQPGGGFVTLRVLGRLRGCVGTLPRPDPLYRTVMDLAVEAATEDDRFDPVDAEELHHTRIEIAVLGELQPLSSPSEIIIGETGLAIEGDPPVIFLPELAAHRGWSAEQFLDAIAEAAGLPPGAWRTGAPIRHFRTEVLREGENT